MIPWLPFQVLTVQLDQLQDVMTFFTDDLQFSGSDLQSVLVRFPHVLSYNVKVGHANDCGTIATEASPLCNVR